MTVITSRGDDEAEGSSSSAGAASPLWLRIIQINDVYELDNFASLYTLKEEVSKGPDRTLFFVCGDFLAPSLLSSLDKGAGMVDCLNAIGVTHVCFGNHECDVPMECLPRRIAQSEFVWVNTNMQDIHDKLHISSTCDYDLLQVTNGHQTKAIALLGLLTNEDGLYRPGSYANATIEPVIPTAETYVHRLQHKVDLMLPMTHQSIQDDRMFCQHFGGSTFPIVLGGHDHTPFDETHNQSRIFKTGMDAHEAGIIDILWQPHHHSSDTSRIQPTITAKLIPVAPYPPNPTIQARTESHQVLLRELEQARLFPISNWISKDHPVFSTCNNRLEPGLGSTALTTMLRMGMRCTCAFVNAGSIRGNTVYDANAFFTWNDLKAEIPYPTFMTALYLPGQVLQDSITYSRLGSRETPPVAKGGYIHTCNNIVYNDETQTIESIDGAPFSPHQLYLTALPMQFLKGIDNNVPILEWAQATHWKRLSDESTIAAKLVIVELYSALLWLQLGSFQDMDLDGDGVLTKDDVRAGVLKHYGGDSTVADLVVDNVMAIADVNGSGTILPIDMMIVHFVATDMVHHVSTEDECRVMRETAAHVLGRQDPNDPEVVKMVNRIKERLDTDRDGKIRRKEAMKALGELRRRSLLI